MRVALICAHFTIIVRDRIVVGWPWRLCPALLRQLFCYSDGVRVFVLNGARAPPFATARYSVFVVGSSRKSNDLKSYAATPTTPIQHAVSLLRTRRTCLLSSLRFKGSWNEISFRKQKERWRFKTIKTRAPFSTGSGLNRVIPALCLISVESVDAGSGHRGVAKVTREELRSSLHLCCAANS